MPCAKRPRSVMSRYLVVVRAVVLSRMYVMWENDSRRRAGFSTRARCDTCVWSHG